MVLIKKMQSVFLCGCLCVLTASAFAVKKTTKSTKTPIKRLINRTRTKLPRDFNIAENSYLSTKEYRDLRNGVLAILKKYPPHSHYYVGLGRDPAPIIAFMQNLGGKRIAVNLPGTSGTNTAVSNETVARYLESTIPKQVLGGKKNLVLLDVTRTGKTPAAFSPLIKTYFQKIGKSKKIIPLALVISNTAQSVRATYPGVIAMKMDEKFPDFAKYPWGKYEGNWDPTTGGTGIAEHERHVISDTGSPPSERNPNYTAFKSKLLKRMKQDGVLDRALLRNKWIEGRAIEESSSSKTKNIHLVKLTLPTQDDYADKPGALLRLELINSNKSEDEDENDNEGDSKSNDQQLEFLSVEDYEELRDQSIALVGETSPEKSYYIGVGRSAGPVTSFLMNLGKGVVSYLPADGIHKYSGTDKITEARKQLFFELFDSFIPTEVLVGTRQLVLFQHASSGRSLPIMKKMLDEYLRREQSNTKVVTVSLIKEGDDPAKNSIVVPPYKAKYNNVSPYDYFRPGSSKNPKRRSKKKDNSKVLKLSGTPRKHSEAFVEFTRLLSHRMAGDEALGDLLKVHLEPATK